MLLSPIHQYSPPQRTKHINQTYTLDSAGEAMGTPVNSSRCSQQCSCSTTNKSQTESCPHRSQQISSPIFLDPETSPATSRRLRGWVRSALTQGSDRPIFDMSQAEEPKADQNVFHKASQHPTQENVRPSSAPTNPSTQRDQSLFGSASNTSSAIGDWNHRRSYSASRHEQHRLDRIKATIDSEQAQAMLLKQGVKTKDFQLDEDKLRSEKLSNEEQMLLYTTQRRLAESYKRGKGI